MVMNGVTTAKSTNPKLSRKFVKEEKRETSNIKLALYAAYLFKGGY